MREPQMLVLTPRRRGRPRAHEPGSTMSVWVPARYHDVFCRIANEKDLSVSKVVAKVLAGAVARLEQHQKAPERRLKRT